MAREEQKIENNQKRWVFWWRRRFYEIVFVFYFTSIGWSFVYTDIFPVSLKRLVTRKEFMLCRSEEKDPRKCIKEGKAVTACALNFFQTLKKSCSQEVTQYAECLDKSSHDFRYKQCRQTQAVFDKCVLNHMGIERPPYNYYNIPQVHHTERPRPIEKGTPEFPDPSPRLPDDFQAPPAKFGSSRNFN